MLDWLGCVRTNLVAEEFSAAPFEANLIGGHEAPTVMFLLLLSDNSRGIRGNMGMEVLALPLGLFYTSRSAPCLQQHATPA
jgi:hypothetical protein